MGENYDETYRQGDYFGTEESVLLRDHGSLLPAAARVLDIGVGQGRNALPLARAGMKVTGIDTSRTAVAQTLALASAQEIEIAVHRRDILEYDPDEAFDAVLCFGLLQILSPSQAASLIHRLHAWIKPEGVLFLTAWHLLDPGYQRLRAEWQSIGEHAFRSPDGVTTRYFLGSGQVLTLFPGWQVVHHWEGLGPPHRHGDGPIERHGNVELIAKKLLNDQ